MKHLSFIVFFAIVSILFACGKKEETNPTNIAIDPAIGNAQKNPVTGQIWLTPAQIIIYDLNMNLYTDKDGNRIKLEIPEGYRVAVYEDYKILFDALPIAEMIPGESKWIPASTPNGDGSCTFTVKQVEWFYGIGGPDFFRMGDLNQRKELLNTTRRENHHIIVSVVKDCNIRSMDNYNRVGISVRFPTVKKNQIFFIKI